MELTEYRDQINEIDDQILALLQRRAEISKKVGAVKAETGTAQVYVPHRQKQVIERLKAQNQGKFPEAALESIWTEILSASRFFAGDGAGRLSRSRGEFRALGGSQSFRRVNGVHSCSPASGHL